MIKQGRERSNAEIIQGLHEMRLLVRIGLPIDARDEALLVDAARRIEDQEERIDILTADLPGDEDLKYMLEAWQAVPLGELCEVLARHEITVQGEPICAKLDADGWRMILSEWLSEAEG